MIRLYIFFRNAVKIRLTMVRAEAGFGVVMNRRLFKDCYVLGCDAIQKFTEFLEEYFASSFRAVPNYMALCHRRPNFHSYGCMNLRPC